jgi:SAM-dependent methyltransferase
MVALFVCTLFLSSTLLFLVQPMIAKMVLPLLGGTPAVWNTCMVFFQATLLLGYLYVHAVTRWLRLGQQALLHIVLLVLSLLALPIALAAHDEPPSTGTPIFWLARVLLLSVGFPFFVVSTSGPLLQRWFARTNKPGAQDPYFLSVAGNLGSIAALLAYPAGLEPRLRLAEQSWLWAGCYTTFVLLMIVSVAIAYRTVRQQPATSDSSSADAPAEAVSIRQKLRWIGLAFIPSSLMLGLTTFLTTDVAPVPLFWVVPQTLYLLSFALVFARRQVIQHTLMLRMLPLLALVLVTVLVFASQLSPLVQGPLHLLTFFAAAMVCHGELARSRPTSSGLTEFYLLVSVGGVLGGLFNALVAPAAFRTVVEYPLAIILACAARPASARFEAGTSQPAASRLWQRGLDVAVPLALGLIVFGLLSAFAARDSREPLPFLLLYVAPPLICFSLKARPLRFALGLAALMIPSSVYLSAHQPVALAGRSYYSVFKVVTDPTRNLRLLVHARTVHGAQSLDPSRAGEPLTYFHRTGPIGQAFESFAGPYAKSRVAVVGLGAGTLAAYAQPGQNWTFYEIDPAIESMARDPRYFTYLRDARADVRVVLGDARLSLAKEADNRFDLLVIDAFGADAIPVHLLTSEALRIYLRTVQPHGVLAFHLSNRYMDLQPLVGDLANAAGLVALAQDQREISAADEQAGKAPSTWVVVARAQEDLGSLASDSRWRRLQPQASPRVWTDDFSNPLSVMRWF